MKFEAMDQRWQFRKLVKTIDPVSGEETTAPGNLIVTSWCEFKGLQGVETFEVGGEVVKARGNVITRYVPGVAITAKDWDAVSEDGRQWDIVGEPRMIGRRQGLEIPVEVRS